MVEYGRHVAHDVPEYVLHSCCEWVDYKSNNTAHSIIIDRCFDLIAIRLWMS